MGRITGSPERRALFFLFDGSREAANRNPSAG